jgi:hypothetical protein
VRAPRISATLVRRLSLLAAAIATILALAACGRIAHPTSADNEGVYVDAGPLTYQVQLSRELNPYDVEDEGYLAGVTASPLRPDELWFGVFMWAKNETHAPHATTDSFAIVDTEGTRYYPVAIDSSVNRYAWSSQTLRPLGVEPVPDSTAYFGPTQGGLLLFKLNNSIYSNRPLTLLIYAPGQAHPSTVSLDL